MLDPVITLGIEHVLLIVKAPGLSPSLPMSQWYMFRREKKQSGIPVSKPVLHLFVEDG